MAKQVQTVSYNGETNGVDVTGVGYVLGQARVKRQMTLEQVAGILGVSSKFLGDIEHGRRPLSAKNAPIVAAVLGLDINEVAGLALMETSTFKNFKAVTKTA